MKTQINIKTLLASWLLLSPLLSLAQLTKSPDLKKSLSRFLPYDEKTGLKEEAYLLDATVFLQKLADFEVYSKTALASVSDPALRERIMKDQEYYDSRLLWTFVRGQVKGSGKKSIDPAIRKQIEQRVFYDVNPNQLELFKSSENYRTAVEEKILYLAYTQPTQADLRNKEAKVLAQRKIAGEIVSEPYILAQLNCGYTVALLKAIPSAARRDSVYKDFLAGKASRSEKAEVEQTYRRQLDYGDNGMAPDFEYADVNGKKIKLSDLRGKYVYIDIWATWCGPCKAQIPFLAKLEGDYHSKNIQFLSISIDEQKDRSKWADFVKKEQLGGIQVIADRAFQSEFVQKFNINAIPRFILIDPSGKIISANAKRPSDPELRKQLSTLL